MRINSVRYFKSQKCFYEEFINTQYLWMTPTRQVFDVRRERKTRERKQFTCQIDQNVRRLHSRRLILLRHVTLIRKASFCNALLPILIDSVLKRIYYLSNYKILLKWNKSPSQVFSLFFWNLHVLNNAFPASDLFVYKEAVSMSQRYLIYLRSMANLLTHFKILH